MTREATTSNALRLARRLDTIAASPDVNPSQRALLHSLLTGKPEARNTLPDVDEHGLRALLTNLRRRGERRSVLYVVR